jgi:hypothetical protein
MKESREVQVIFANPDYAQQEIREHALLDGKPLAMPSTIAVLTIVSLAGTLTAR